MYDRASSDRRGQDIRGCGRKNPSGAPQLYDEFVEQLMEAEQKKLDRAVSRLADRGLPTNVQKGRAFKGLENLVEIKEHGLRVIWFESGERSATGKRVRVLTHGFRKKSNRTPSREIERAERIKREYMATYCQR
jgi:phage-related protein